MRKTTTYARKQRQSGGTFNGAAYLNTIQAARPYTETAAPALGLFATHYAALKALVIVKTALVALTTGATPAGNEEHFDLLSHALGVSCIRAAQIEGSEPECNPILPPLIEGNNALRQVLYRRRKWRKWEVLPAEAAALAYAVEVYETILMASSPLQMATAVDLRLLALKGQTMEGVEA